MLDIKKKVDLVVVYLVEMQNHRELKLKIVKQVIIMVIIHVIQVIQMHQKEVHKILRIYGKKDWRNQQKKQCKH